MSISTITSQELKDLLVRQPDLPLIDVRMPNEFREVHVVGARNLPLDRLSPEQFESEEKDAKVYFICKGGVRSLKACEKALVFGLSDVVNVEGGTDACLNAGLPVEHGAKAVSLERQVRIIAGALILLGGVLAIAVHPYWAALAAFVGAGLLFSGITGSCTMGMLLAKMPWNR
jgi:rhodanese-related sulfurtransferase